jgi:hypothetical protein
MNIYIRIQIVLLSFLISTCVKAIELPSPPSGFGWQDCNEINAHFLKPDGWFYKHVRQQGIEAFFISRENIDKEGAFSSGLTINYYKGVKHKVGVMPSEYEERTREAAKSKHHVDDEKKVSHGSLQGISYKFTFSPGGSNPKRTLYNLSFPDDKEDTLLLIMFESPSAEWEEAWKFGKLIVEKFVMDE